MVARIFTEQVKCPKCGHRVEQENVSRNEFSLIRCVECDTEMERC